MRETVRAAVDEVTIMEELSDNHRHGETREMIFVLEEPRDTLKGI